LIADQQSFLPTPSTPHATTIQEVIDFFEALTLDNNTIIFINISSLNDAKENPCRIRVGLLVPSHSQINPSRRLFSRYTLPVFFPPDPEATSSNNTGLFFRRLFTSRICGSLITSFCIARHRSGIFFQSGLLHPPRLA
jgi:hypothetical protein